MCGNNGVGGGGRGQGEGNEKGWMAAEDEEFGKSQLSVRLHVENLSSSCLAHKNGVKHRILPSSKAKQSKRMKQVEAASERARARECE